MEDEAVGETGLVRRAAVVLEAVMDVGMARSRMERLQEFCASYLQESKNGGTDGGDFGIIPNAGTKKVLFKSGGEKLCDVYGLAPAYKFMTPPIEDFDRGLFDYTIECRLTSKVDDSFVGSGLGSCSSFESKYRWREINRACPQCGKEAIIRGKPEFGGGFICWAKKDGCGAKFSATDPAITSQTIGRVENPDIVDTKNTVLKMARKRAFLDAVIGATRSSGIFTQDLEEHFVETTPSEPVSVGSSATPAATEQKAAATTAQASTAAAAPASTGTKPKGQCPETQDGVRCNKPAGHITTHEFPKPKLAAKADEAAAKVATETPSVGVKITSLNVKNGPIDEATKKPKWGPLYIVGFSAKVLAQDGNFTIDASTFDEKIAQAAETARDSDQPVIPTVVAGSKKGSYNITALDIPLNR